MSGNSLVKFMGNMATLPNEIPKSGVTRPTNRQINIVESVESNPERNRKPPEEDDDLEPGLE